MKYIFLLSGENIDFAKDEVNVLLNAKSAEIKSFDGLLIVDYGKNEINKKKLDELCSRLAFTRSVFKILFEAKIEHLKEMLSGYDWDKIYKKNFCVRISHMQKNKARMQKNKARNEEKNIKAGKGNVDREFRYLSEKEIGAIIWNRLKNKKIEPVVNLNNPKTFIAVFIYGGYVFVSVLEKKIMQKFGERGPARRPEVSPVSLSPKIARGMVNLSGAEPGEKIVDPFCGTGGILIEAGLMNLAVEGYDIDETMLNKCRKNLEYFKIDNYSLKQDDAIGINKKIKYLVTDLQYGKSSRITLNPSNLYLAFLKNLEKNLVKKAVVGFPNTVEYNGLIKKTRLRIEKEYSFYIHKSLTKKIVVLRPALS